MSKHRHPTPPKPPETTAPVDPVVEAQIQRSLKPYVGRVPPAALAEMRARLEEALTTHPVGMALIDQQRERDPATVKISGDHVRDRAAAADDDAGGTGAS